MPARDLSHDDIVRIYGPWACPTPADAALFLADYPGRWWVAGGWAVQAFTGVSRSHGDLDIGIPWSELPVLRAYLAGRLDLWAAAQEVLQLLLPADADSDRLPSGCENVWARVDGASPWQYDFLLTEVRADVWVFKHAPRVVRPLDEVVWVRDGISYLKPAAQLLYKAHRVRPKDQADFETTWPLLDSVQRGWLQDGLRAMRPDHPWLLAD